VLEKGFAPLRSMTGGLQPLEPTHAQPQRIFASWSRASISLSLNGLHEIHVSRDPDSHEGQIPSALSERFEFLSPKTTKTAPGFPRRLSFAR
jgi:hypothetical protein